MMCTTLIVTKGASADGSMLVAHSDDDELGDQRMIYVPAQTHEPGSMRPVFQEHYIYPRMVTDERGPQYNTPGYPETKPLGYIPQVPQTYAYFDGAYGIMNEHNLMIGECTNAAKHEPDPVTASEAAEHSLTRTIQSDYWYRENQRSTYKYWLGNYYNKFSYFITSVKDKLF